MRIKLTILLLLISTSVTFSQELRLVVSDKPLNTVLNMLNVEISLDDKALSNYKVSVSRSFNSAHQAIEYLLKDKPFKIEVIGSVFVILPDSPVINRSHVKKKYIISGELLDITTGESLSYAYIQTDKGIILTDEFGQFSIIRSSDLPVKLQVQYIGYEVLDTLLSMGPHKIHLSPKVIQLDEVVIKPSSSIMFMQSGQTSGEIRSNSQVSQYIPGSIDNSVSTLLRMVPGVRASGEPSNDLIVWGSNWGESRLTYDGFTIFAMKSFNDQIGSVNPYIAKDIRLKKAGYDASNGNIIGAIAEVTGSEGDFNSPSIKANVSNYTANIYASIPIKKRFVFSAAYRQTFYNLYSKQRTDNETGDHTEVDQLGIYIKPNYDFKDLNLKFAGKAFDNDSYYVSLYGADDHFKFFVKQLNYELEADEKNRQYGVSSGYNKVWNNGSRSKLLFSFSKLSSIIDNISGITDDQSEPAPLKVFSIENSVQESSLKLEHNFNLGEIQKLQIGGQWQLYTTKVNSNQTYLNYPSLYITDNIALGKLALSLGLRADFIPNKKIYLQPRLSASYRISDVLTATASLGLYNQFLTRTPYKYGSSSYQMVWDLLDNAYLSSMNYLAGMAYSKNGWLFTAEGYLKKVKNQMYYLDNNVSIVDNTIFGADLYAKKQWNNNSIFGSYSLVNSAKPEQSIGHEVKLGGIISFKSFHISGTYIYGSGFPYLSTSSHGHGQSSEEDQHNNEYQHSDSTYEPYSRCDISVTYSLKLKKLSIQIGASILNVFNTTNVKYSYRLSDQNSVYNIYTKATPFTPILFINFR